MQNRRKKLATGVSSLVLVATIIASQIALDDSTLVGRYNLQNSNVDKNYDFDYSFDTSYGDSNLLNLVFDNGEVVCDDMVPQGITIIGDYIAISAYDCTYMNNSMLYLFDMNLDFIKSIKLDNHAHVGAIAYDDKRQLLWVAGLYGSVDAYTISSVFNNDGGIKPIYKNVYVGKGLSSYLNPFVNSVSYLTIDGDDLYVGNYSLLDNAVLKQYSISIDGNSTLHLKYENSYDMPSKVQGVSFYHDEKDDYIFLSRSCGRNHSSIIQLYKCSDEVKDYRVARSVVVEAPNMLEQISIVGDDMYVLNESQAKKYYKGTKKDTVFKTSVTDLIKKY